MLLGSSRPYPWLILEENRRYDDDDGEDGVIENAPDVTSTRTCGE